MLRQFIRENQHADVTQLALQRKRYSMISDSDFRFCLQQIEGRQRTRDKLPAFAAIDGWLYPPRLNLEQCSSEQTARLKAQLLQQFRKQQPALRLIDATGGYGVDTFFMSEQATETHYFEQNTELATIAQQNFRLACKDICCHAEPFDTTKLQAFSAHPSALTVLYIDPSRRDAHGGRVFRLADCTPNVIDIVACVRQHYTDMYLLLKLSPMLDFHQAIRELGGIWEVYVVSIGGEVKELLLLSAPGGSQTADGSSIARIHAVTMKDNASHLLTFTPDEESEAQVQYWQGAVNQESLAGMYVYEPDAALLKAGCFRLLSARYGLLKAAQHTHLYLSQSPDAFRTIPASGRVWHVAGVYANAKVVQRTLARANVLTRNYVMPADILRKHLRFKDGGEDYIIGCRIQDKPVLLHGRLSYPMP